MSRVSITSIFCQDIREEKVGTVTLVGIFPDNVKFTKIPGVLLKLVVYCRMHADVKDPPRKLSLRIEMPDEQIVKLGNVKRAEIQEAVQKAKGEGSEIAGFIVSAEISPFTVIKSGRILVVATVDGEEYPVGRLNLIVPKAQDDSRVAQSAT